MSSVGRFTPTSLTAEQYDSTIRMLEEGEGALPADALALPRLLRRGRQPLAEPEPFEVHRIVTR